MRGLWSCAAAAVVLGSVSAARAETWTPMPSDVAYVSAAYDASGITGAQGRMFATVRLEFARDQTDKATKLPYRVAFLRFVEDYAGRFPKWKTELDAWLDFRIEEKRASQKRLAS